MPAKKCEVCGGHVKPVDERNVFGYCERCGLVYALIQRVEEDLSGGGLGGREERPFIGETRPDVPLERDLETTRPLSGTRWTCPDCGAEFKLENPADLEFVRREHVREYHPNR